MTVVLLPKDRNGYSQVKRSVYMQLVPLMVGSFCRYWSVGAAGGGG